MCQNCQPQETIETAVETIEPGIIPYEYHDERKEYTSGGDTLTDSALQAIQRMLIHWRTVTENNIPETIPPLDTILRFVQVWNCPDNFEYERNLIEDCLVPGMSHMRAYWRSVGTPNLTIVSADTPEKRQANESALAKKWHRFISDCYGLKINPDSCVTVSRILDSVGIKHKENGQSYGKRLAKAFHDSGWKLTKKQIETINNVADSGISKPQTYSVAFDNDYLDASPSQYGNSRSCWWQDGDYGHSRHTFHADGGFACRLFDHRGAVTGRVWIVPTEYGHLIFNSYLTRIDTFARMLADAWKCDCVDIAIKHDSEFYINGDEGYLIGDKAKFPIDGVIQYRPEFVENDDIVGSACHHCNRRVSEDYSYSTSDGYTCCESCYCEYYSSCGRCGETLDSDDVIDCNGDSYCERCAERQGFSRCDDCGEWSDDHACVNNGNCVCSDCLDSYTCCEGCSEYFDNDECEVSPNDDCSYCCDCMPEDELTGEQYCQATGELIDVDDIGSNWPAYPVGALSSRAHCPVIPLFSSELPVSANAIGQMMERVANGSDISAFPAAVTAMALCLAGF